MTCTPFPDDLVPRYNPNDDIATATEDCPEGDFLQLLDPDTGRLKADLADLQPCPVCGQNAEKPLLVKQGFPFVRCGGCGMIYMSPRLKDEVSEQRMRTDPELRERFHAALVQQNGEREERILRSHLVRLRAAIARGKLLDINCGLGDFMMLARSAGYVVSGVELHQFAADHARSNGFIVHEEPLGRLKLSTHSVDVVTALNVLGREQNPLNLLRAIRRVLKPRGRLLVTCPNVESLANQILGLERTDMMDAPDQVNWFSRFSLQRLFSLAGFKIVEMSCVAMNDLEKIRRQMEQAEITVNPFLHRLFFQKENDELRRDLTQLVRRHWMGSHLLAECVPAAE